MKSRNFLLGFFVLSIIAISAMLSANAAVYSLGVKMNDEFTYQITTVDQAGLEEVYGPDWAIDLGDYSVKGAKKKYLITKIDDAPTYWKLTVSVWDLTTTDFAELPDYTGHMGVLKDPNDAPTFPVFICPTPVSSYLTAIAGKWPSALEAEGDTLTLTFTTYKRSYTFDNSKGVLTSEKWIYGGKTIWEFKRMGIIPGYELSMLLGVSAITTIGLIYVLMKKK